MDKTVGERQLKDRLQRVFVRDSERRSRTVSQAICCLIGGLQRRMLR
jgi:hypothetical protein